MTGEINFSIVIPVHNSAPYLGQLFSSLESQVEGPFNLECIFVDDGSTDNSRRLIEEWLRTTTLVGKLIIQENLGVSAARNRGLESASGDWVGFPDSDDFLGHEYFASIATRLLEHKAEHIDIVSANVLRYFEAADVLDRGHPLSFKFLNGSRVVNLDSEPRNIQTQVASAMFRREVLAECGHRFITDLHAAEDALFVARYLLGLKRRRMLCVAEAEYVYRRRASGDSAVDKFKFSPDFYFNRFTRGYSPLLEEAAATGHVPVWMTNMFIYDLSWFFPREETPYNRADHLASEEKELVIEFVSEALRYVSADRITEYDVTALSVKVRFLLLALKGSALPLEGRAKVAKIDDRIVEIRYLFTGWLPAEEVHSAFGELEPIAARTRKPDYFGQGVLRERIIRVRPADEISLVIDGKLLPLSESSYENVASVVRGRRDYASDLDSSIRPNTLASRLRRGLKREVVSWLPRLFRHSVEHQPGMLLRETRHTRFVRFLARVYKLSERYDDAWTFVDGVESGGGNAERIYDYVSRQMPRVNSRIVIRKGSGDWDRLKSKGARLVAYGSVAHKVLLIHSRFVISSKIDPESLGNVPHRYYGGARPWRLVYVPGELDVDSRLAILFEMADIDLLVLNEGSVANAILRDDSPFSLTCDSVRVIGKDGFPLGTNNTDNYCREVVANVVELFPSSLR